MLDTPMHESIDAEAHGEVIACQSPYWEVKHCIEKYPTNLSSWFGERGRAIFIVLGHSIKPYPTMIISEYSNMKVVFSPDTCITLFPLQLGAVYELHVVHKTVIVHVMQQNAAISIELPIANSITLHYVFTWLSVIDLALVSGWLASGLVLLPGVQSYSISGSLHH